VGSAKASASLSVAADVYSEASGSDVSSLCSIHASPSTGSPLQGAATGQLLLPAIWLQIIVIILCKTCIWALR